MKILKCRYSGEIVLGLSAFLSVCFMIVLNNENIKLRLVEIKNILSMSETVTGTIDHSGLIIQYRYRMDMYRKKIDSYSAGIVEMRADSMFAADSSDVDTDESVSPALSFVVDRFKSLLGRKSYTRRVKENSGSLLESAYYFERNCLYEKAIQKYDAVLKSGIMKGPGIGGIMLHQGFCLSMSGDIAGARKKYSGVIKSYPDDVISITASILLGYLDEFVREAEIVKVMPDSPEKGEKLFYLAAFRDSLAVIESIRKQGKQRFMESANFFKARCLESMGNPADALLYYQEIIQKNPRSQFARYANRRVFIISSKIGDSDDSLELAVKNNRIIRDESFDSFMREGKILKSKTERASLWPADKPVPDFELMIKKFEESVSVVKPVLDYYKGRRVRVITTGGDIILGLAIEENNTSITVMTIAGDAVIQKSSIVKSEAE